MGTFTSPAFFKALVTLAALVILAGAFEVAQTLLAPILTAIVVGVVFGPFTDWFERYGLPRAAAAFFVLILIGTALGALVIVLEPTVSHAIANAPSIWAEMREIADFLRSAVSGVQELQDQVTDALASEPAKGPEGEAEAVPVPSLFDALAYGPSLLAGLLLFAGTLYFFLATRMSSYQGLSRVFPGTSVDCLVAAERQVSRYFLAITIVNAAFGVLTFLLMSGIGMPQPVMWGLAVFLMNYVLYLGPALVALALLVVGIVTFDGAMSFVPMALFLVLNMAEAQFVTPSFVGRQMELNPLLVFLSLAGWLWLWGPIGGLIAIPALVWMLFVFEGRTPPASDAAGPDTSVVGQGPI